MLWWCFSTICFFKRNGLPFNTEEKAIRVCVFIRVCVCVRERERMYEYVPVRERLVYVPENTTQGGWDGTGVNERVTKKASEHRITKCG